MAQHSGTDPVFDALDHLVRSGRLTPDRAQAAYDASRGAAAPVAPVATAPAFPGGRPGGPESVAIAVGVALLSGAIALSTVYSRAREDLDLSNFTVGVAATLGLLGIAAAAWLQVRDPHRRDDLVAWPGALGAVGAGLMIGVALDDDPFTPYVAGLAILALSIAGYLLVRRSPFVVSAIAGLLVLYLEVVDEALDLGGLTDGDNAGIAVGAALLVFTVGVTAAGWLLPTRVLSGLVVGVLAVLGNVVLLGTLALVGAFEAAFAGIGAEGGQGPARDDTFHNDVWFVLVFSTLLVAGWGWCAWRTGHVGFRLLIVALVTGILPTAALTLAVDHPTWWAVAVGVPGGLVLVAAGLRATGRLPAQRHP